MKLRKSTLLSGIAIASLAFVGSARAAMVSVTGPTSSAGSLAQIIAAPPFAQNGQMFNTAQQGFDERQNVLLAANLAVDNNAQIANGGMISAGTTVNSHMIFLNKENGVSGNLIHNRVEWTFDGIILGVMSDKGGTLESTSTPILGAIGTNYDAPFSARGMEGDDTYTVTGNKLLVDMGVSQPGDWIRVVTSTQVVPVPAAAWMGLSLLSGIGVVRRWRSAA